MEINNINNLFTSINETFHKAIDNGLSNENAFLQTIDSIKGSMESIGLENSSINEIISKYSGTYESAINDGNSPVDAFDISVKELNIIINKIQSSKLDDSLPKTNNDLDTENIDNKFGVEKGYNFDFANSNKSEAIELMNNAIAQGMTMEEALVFVNKKLFPDQDDFHGPPTLAEYNEITNKKNIEISKDNENNELNIIEADMDAEAGNVVLNPDQDSYDKSNNSSDELINSDKDDEIS